MTQEEAVQFLVEQGYSDQQALALVQSLPLGTEGGRATGLIDPEDLRQFTEATVPGQEGDAPFYPGDSTKFEEPTPPSQVDLLTEGLENQSLGIPLTEEQEQAQELASQDEWATAIEAFQARDQQFNYDWVYNNLQVRPGTLDSNQALLKVFDRMIEFGVIEPDDPDVPTEDEAKATYVKEILARNGSNQLVQMTVLDWAQEDNVYTPDQRIDGVSVQDIGALMERGLSLSRATTFGRIGNQFEMSPSQLYDIWNAHGRPDEELAKIGTAGPRPFSVKKTPFQVATDFKEGLDQYEGSTVLAAIHASDPELAARLKSDPYSLDSGELRRAVDLLGGEEGTSESGDPQVNWLRTRLAGGHQMSATVASDEDVKMAVETLAGAWNMTGSEDVVAAVSRELISDAVAQARARLPNPFGGLDQDVTISESGSPSGYARQRLKGTQEYEELFRHLAPGESEEEFANRFDRRTQSVLGDDVVSVSRNAMRSGNINTPYQQGLITDVGESSTRFQEILARNAQTFREML